MDYYRYQFKKMNRSYATWAAAQAAALEQARGTYQRRLVLGYASWSGSDLAETRGDLRTPAVVTARQVLIEATTPRRRSQHPNHRAVVLMSASPGFGRGSYFFRGNSRICMEVYQNGPSPVPRPSVGGSSLVVQPRQCVGALVGGRPAAVSGTERSSGRGRLPTDDSGYQHPGCASRLPVCL